MKKILLTFACALSAMAMFSACDKGEDVKEFKDENATVKALTIEATLPSAQGEGMKTAFTAKDFLRIRFAKADGTSVGRTQILRGEAAEGKTASFSNRVAVPNDAETAFVYVDNNETNLVNYGSAPTFVNLGGQKGTLADAMAHQVIVGSTPVSGLSGGKGSVSLAYKTGIAKIVVSYPEGTRVKPGETTVTLGGDAQYNKIELALDSPEKSSTKGAITVPAIVDTVKCTSTAYVAIWPVGGEYTNTNLISHIQTTTYGNALEVTNIVAGKTTEIAQGVDAKEFNYWIGDEKYTVPDVYAQVESASNWITVKNGVLTVEENKTGSVRVGKVVLNNGHTYIFTQIGANDFKGSWTLYSKRFNPNGTVTGGDNNANETVVTFGEPLKKETLTDASGKEHTNNLGIKGLYLESVLDACVEIDYEARTVNFGIFFDRRAAQSAGAGKYCVYLPECAGVNTWGNYNFAPGDKAFSDSNYEWLWFTVSEDLKTLKYQYYGAGQKTSNGKYYICGISCVKATSADKSSIAGSYDVIYQANYKNSNSDSMYFAKK